MTIDELFHQILDEMPGYEGALAATFAGQMLGAHSADGVDLGRRLDALCRMVGAYHEAYEDLGGILSMGGNDEILVTTTKHYLLVKLHHQKEVFLAVMIASSGNIGYLRVKMKRYLDQVVKA